jgi:hypothetical protein
MCAGGPPNPVTPIRVHPRATVTSDAWFAKAALPSSRVVVSSQQRRTRVPEQSGKRGCRDPSPDDHRVILRSHSAELAS